MTSTFRLFLAAVFAAAFTTPAFAYIGPGGGLSALGALLALIAGLAIAFFGFLWYPLRRMRRRRRQLVRTNPPEAAVRPEDKR